MAKAIPLKKVTQPLACRCQQLRKSDCFLLGQLERVPFKDNLSLLTGTTRADCQLCAHQQGVECHADEEQVNRAASDQCCICRAAEPPQGQPHLWPDLLLAGLITSKGPHQTLGGWF